MQRGCGGVGVSVGVQVWGWGCVGAKGCVVFEQVGIPRQALSFCQW